MTWKYLIETDQRWSSRLRLDPSRKQFFTLFAFLAHSGDSWFWLAGLAALWLAAIPAWRLRSAVMMIGIVILAALVLLIKFTIRRQRPEGEWGAIYRSTDPHSFPSGHAARAFMLAVLAISLGPGWLGAVVLVWAPLVCLARVRMGVHYVSDVVAGAFLGILAGGVFAVIFPMAIPLFPFIF